MTRIADLMSHTLISLRPEDRADEALRYLLQVGVHTAPVIDPEGRARGMLSIADLTGDVAGAFVRDRMSTPAITLPLETDSAEAARVMTEEALHHVPVVDGFGCVVGFLSALDLLGGHHPFVGREAWSPKWSPELMLTRDHAGEVPEAGGVIVVSDPRRNAVLWAERAADLRHRFLALLEAPPEMIAWSKQGGPPSVRFVVTHGRAEERKALGHALSMLALGKP